MNMTFRAQKQVEEALGEDNRWFCSKAKGRQVDDPDELLMYFCKSGGAADFARRFAEAFGKDNRYYCSKFYGFCVEDEQLIWDYYNTHAVTAFSSHRLQNANCD